MSWFEMAFALLLAHPLMMFFHEGVDKPHTGF